MIRGTSLGAFLVCVVISLAAVTPARAGQAPTCSTAVFETSSPPLLAGGGSRVSMRDGLIHVPGCSPIPATIKPRKKRIGVKAVWNASQCPGVGKVRLKARLDLACTTMSGVLKAKRYKKRFVAGLVPPVPPPSITVDPGVVPSVAQVAGFDGEPPRPVAAVSDDAGVAMHFVENEVVVVSDDAGAVAALAASLGGSVVRTIGPAAVGLGGSAQHLVRFDPGQVDPSALAGDLHAIDPTVSGTLRVSNDTGLRTLAAAARGAIGGVTVAPNVVLTPYTYVDRTTAENVSLPLCTPPATLGCVPAGIANGPGGAAETFNTNAFAWSYMGTGPGTQDIGVGEAWRTLWLAQRMAAGAVKVAFIDGGFAPSTDHPAGWEHHENSIHVDGFPPNDLACTAGAACPWHGTNVVSAAMGVPDDAIGAAGPGGPVATPVTIRMSGDVFNYIGAWTIAFASGARVLSLSFGARLPATLAFAAKPLELATHAAREAGMLILAAAGNDGFDVDSEDCAPPFDWPCWEDAFFTPCENAGVTCIGSLADNATTKRASSNYGHENVELFGPGNLWVGADPADGEPHLFSATSAATPFVAGVAALVFAADPSLDGDAVEAILLESARPSADGNVRRYVDAQAAVLRGLGSGPICLLPTVVSGPSSRESLACNENLFGVGIASGVLGPVTYVWRRYQGDVPVELTDSGRFSGTRTSQMRIAALQQEDYGAYDVVVTNPCGTVTSGRAIVSPPVGGIVQAGSLPATRSHLAMAYDRARARMVMHGGWFETLTPENFIAALNVRADTFERDGDGVWHFVTNVGPSPRYGHAMAYDEARGVTVLFGGYLCADTLCAPGSAGAPVAYQDTWEWNGTTWTERVVASPPPARWLHAMTYDPQRQRVVMIGGRDGGNALTTNDVWEWDGTTWSVRSTIGDPTIGPSGDALGFPARREAHGLAYDRGRTVLVLHGGAYSSAPNVRFGETWELSAGGQWTLRAVAPNVLSGLYYSLIHPNHQMTYDWDHGRTLLASLGNETGQVGDNVGRLWEWDGTTWTPRAYFPWRERGAIAYDEGRARSAIAGGNTNFISRSDVWEWRYFDEPPACEP